MRAELGADHDIEIEASRVTPSRGNQYKRTVWIWNRDTQPLAVVKPIRARQVLLTSFVLQTQRVLDRTPVAVVAVVVGLVTMLVHGYHLSGAPDVFSDEGVYLLVGKNLASGAGLTIDHSMFLWHPPAYFLVEAVYIKLAGLTNADPLAALLSVRYLNIFFSASTAVLLVFFGR